MTSTMVLGKSSAARRRASAMPRSSRGFEYGSIIWKTSSRKSRRGAHRRAKTTAKE